MWGSLSHPLIGGGVLGAAVARELSRDKEDVTLCQNVLEEIFGEEGVLRPKKRIVRKKYGRK